MNCKDVHSIRFDFHDGSLSAKDRKAVEDHLAICAPCREFLEDEARFAENYRAAFAERKRVHRFQADAIRFPSYEDQSDRGISPNRTKRFFRVLAPITMCVALVLGSILLFRPFRHAKGPHDLKASFVSDDLPDPFRDWIEKRMIITIEDKATGSLERIETNRHGIVARSTETRGNR
jgi:anti-sigma factor RsiW